MTCTIDDGHDVYYRWRPWRVLSMTAMTCTIDDGHDVYYRWRPWRVLSMTAMTCTIDDVHDVYYRWRPWRVLSMCQYYYIKYDTCYVMNDIFHHTGYFCEFCNWHRRRIFMCIFWYTLWWSVLIINKCVVLIASRSIKCFHWRHCNYVTLSALSNEILAIMLSCFCSSLNFAKIWKIIDR